MQAIILIILFASAVGVLVGMIADMADEKWGIRFGTACWFVLLIDFFIFAYLYLP